MNRYKVDIEKLYNRITKIVVKGEAYQQRYFDLIDEVISNGQSTLLQDVYIKKFGIDLTKFSTIDGFKKKTFSRVAITLKSKENQNLQTLFDTQNVFPTGNHFFDSLSGRYLGDIKQFDTIQSNKILEVTTFYPSEMKSAIPNFVSRLNSIIPYNLDFVVYYDQSLYKCIQSYTWSRYEQITPTFSNYWTEVAPGTQSYTEISDQTISLIDKYTQAINIIKTSTYNPTTQNFFVELDYVEDYFE